MGARALAAAAPPPPQGGGTSAALEPFESRGLDSAAVARYAAQRLQPLAAEAVRLLGGEEARAAAVAHGWPHVTPTLCGEIRTAMQHLGGLLARWQETLAAVQSLRAELADPSQTAWRALAGRERALPIHEMMRQMAAFMDRGVALIERTRRAAAPAPPPIAAWLDELHRARMTALELIGRSQALLVNAKFGEIGTFLDACVLVHEACTYFFTRGRAAMEARERWMCALLACHADGGATAEARAAAAAAATLYVSPFAQGDRATPSQ